MRQSTLLLNTLRESPAEAEVASHELLLRGGFIRQLAAGIYTYLPLGRRVLRKIEQIIREEMELTGAQEILMPALQPADLWKESGRHNVYGPELMRLSDRNEREFVLGPTHEEVITALVRDEINSYRKLPVTLYQIQTKFRDERRPRFGLLRGREFVMKDAYSFDTDWEGLDRSYRKMYGAYERIFERMGLNYRAVEADAGAIGGEGETHEFMALADIGEDTIVSCTCCDYAANIEAAVGRDGAESVVPSSEVLPREKIQTPGLRTIDELVAGLQVEAQQIIKTLIYKADQQMVAVLVRGDHQVNELKVMKYLNTENLEIVDSGALQELGLAPAGSIGPCGLHIPVLVDQEVASMSEGITGGNEADVHEIHVRPGRDFKLDQVGDFRNVVEGDHCLNCQQGRLKFSRGIEMGHIFKLGTKYSEKLQAHYLNSSGKKEPMIMGCYGIGISRLLSAIAEQCHDDRGMIWPMSVAPFQVHLILISSKNEQQTQAADRLYAELAQQGIEVLYDDRNESAGVKFKDSELIGIPLRITLGKNAEQGEVELTVRKNGHREFVSIDEVVNLVKEKVKG
ncbi:proline--tRNA ligase [Paenibacillus motobuensis]|uniref:Proline--tRNA ligase n=1 Tax=Paenibacillus motobuensis TaxID=295324 RepID=A0ABN0YEP5_9BACL